MATDPIGNDTKTIGINMGKKMAEELEAWAEAPSAHRDVGGG